MADENGTAEVDTEIAQDRQESSGAVEGLMMEDLLENLVKGLVDKPEAVSVEGFDESDGSVTLELRVAEDEAGKVIGRGGRTINALRQVVRAHKDARGRKVVVDLVED